MTSTPSLEFTGERFIPGIPGNIELEHLHRYALAQQLCQGKSVLDIACGEGYGSAMLAQSASHVIGMDISEQAVAHARTRYQADHLEYRLGDCTAIALADASVDMVVSFETIEHHDRHAEMLKELRRVLKPGGCLLISSPDRFFYSEKPGTTNPHHVKELSELEFKSLIESHFRNVSYYGQTVAYGSVILAQSGHAPQSTYWKEGDALHRADGLAMPLFWLALASDSVLPPLQTGLYAQPIEASELMCMKQRDLDNAVAMLKEKDQHLAHAAEMLRAKDEQLARIAKIRALLKNPAGLLAYAFKSLIRGSRRGGQ